MSSLQSIKFQLRKICMPFVRVCNEFQVFKFFCLHEEVQVTRANYFSRLVQLIAQFRL